MPRCGRLRSYIREYKKSPKTEKMSFVPPFLILSLEIILIIHAFFLNEMFVIIITLILLLISMIETILVSREIHKKYSQSNFDRILTIKLDDFITEKKEKNVKRIVVDFIEKYPEYEVNRSEIYHTTCQILETHKREIVEKDCLDKLDKFIKKNKKANVDDIVQEFIKKYPQYSRFRSEIYEKTCVLKDNSIQKK